MTIRGYKGFRKTGPFGLCLKCRDMIYKRKGKNVYNGDVSICKSGFHACHELHEVFPFYPNDGNNVFYEVECSGDIIDPMTSDGKFVCSELKIIRKADVSAFPVFTNAGICKYGYMAIQLPGEGKWALVKPNGEYVFNHTHYVIRVIQKDLFLIGDYTDNGTSYNLVNDKGKLVLDTNFDDYDMYEECDSIIISINGKKRVVSKADGHLVSKEWFDEAYFSYCQCIVINGLWHNILEKDGTYLFDNWTTDFRKCRNAAMKMLEQERRDDDSL